MSFDHESYPLDSLVTDPLASKILLKISWSGGTKFRFSFGYHLMCCFLIVLDLDLKVSLGIT